MGPSSRQSADIAHRIRTWGDALKRECAEHGRPNSFGVAELAGTYNLNPRDGYYLKVRVFELWEYLGGEAWGELSYVKGRFVCG